MIYLCLARRVGFGGPECNFEYNECESNPCSNGGTCLDRVGEFQCICPSGYAGSRCETQVIYTSYYIICDAIFVLLSSGRELISFRERTRKEVVRLLLVRTSHGHTTVNIWSTVDSIKAIGLHPDCRFDSPGSDDKSDWFLFDFLLFFLSFPPFRIFLRSSPSICAPPVLYAGEFVWTKSLRTQSKMHRSRNQYQLRMHSGTWSRPLRRDEFGKIYYI